jgi:hypothetical protein
MSCSIIMTFLIDRWDNQTVSLGIVQPSFLLTSPVQTPPSGTSIGWVWH